LNEESSSPPIFHLLLSEKFFIGKIDPAIQALGWEGRVPDWDGDLLGQLTAPGSIGAVLDLEDENRDNLLLAKELRENKLTANLPILAYSSHEREDLLDAAREIGVTVVIRSTFAANLVRVLMELVGMSTQQEPGDGVA
jgi:CheY-like chemotaxis protein|tara:strand:- start:46687 stop:47103 length:417 start_codon:yes stop_codon:yes gene_type:complete